MDTDGSSRFRYIEEAYPEQVAQTVVVNQGKQPKDGGKPKDEGANYDIGWEFPRFMLKNSADAE